MATTTPNYGWTVPTSTDLVKDGATAIETLGDAIDASMNTALGTKKAGMVLLNTTSFSGVTAQAISSVFSSTYRHYKIVGSITSSVASTTVKLRLRSGSTDNTNTDYAFGNHFVGGDGTEGNSGSSNASTGFYLLALNHLASYPGGVFDYNLYNPFETTYTRITGHSERETGGTAYGYYLGGNLEVTTSYDGINIYTDSATNMSGVVSIYGFNQ